MPVIDSGTLFLGESSLPGPTGSHAALAAQRDELTPIAIYMATQINANAHGPDATRMLEMNSFSSTACISDFTALPLWRQILGFGITPGQCIEAGISFRTASLLAWASKVRQNGEWDHKPKIASMFHPRSPIVQHWHLYGATLYYYDVWSNIHYGYVGRAAGFSESVLLDGAGLEQVGSDLARLKLPSASESVAGLRKWDASEDRAAIEIGIRLYGQRPDSVSADLLLRSVTASILITKKAYAP